MDESCPGLQRPGNEKYQHEVAVLWIRDVYLGSRILIFIHPEFRISDPGPEPTTGTKKEGTISCLTFLVATNITK
jgi:hypothetical protein